MNDEQNATDNPNTGHGHVRPRPDGVLALCGGPAICAECSREAKAAAPAQPAQSAHGCHWKDCPHGDECVHAKPGQGGVEGLREALDIAFRALDRTDSEPGSDAFEREKEAMDAIRGALNAAPPAASSDLPDYHRGWNDGYRNGVRSARGDPMDKDAARPSPAEDAEPVAEPTKGYVQPVPDHCDRITWRNRYYQLPLDDTRPAAPLSEEGADKLLTEFMQAVHRKGELWNQCQGKGWPDNESAEFDRLRDKVLPDLRRRILATMRAAPLSEAQQPHIPIRDLLRIYDEQKGDWCGVAREVERLTIAAMLSPAPQQTDEATDAMAEEVKRLFALCKLKKGNHWLALDVAIDRMRDALAEAQAAPVPLTDADMADLRRLREVFDDGEGYDLPKARMQRLAELGIIRRTGGAYYAITAFGMHCLDPEDWRLPLRTVEEYNEASRQRAIERAHGITPAGTTEGGAA